MKIKLSFDDESESSLAVAIGAYVLKLFPGAKIKRTEKTVSDVYSHIYITTGDKKRRNP